jgi:GT2 family glycosyltransferase
MTFGGKVSIIVLMHNNVAMTKSCLEHLARAVSDIDHEVILLDNASTESTEPVQVFERRFRQFQFIRSAENMTYSKANNLGAGKAAGEWLLFLNNDVMVDRDSIGELVTPLHEDAGIGATGAKLMFPGRKKVQHAGIGHMLWGIPVNYGAGASPFDSRVTEYREMFAVTGAMLCLPHKVFQQVGGFDESYCWGLEDVDLCLKVRTANLRVFFVPEATGIHYESFTLKTNNVCDPSNNYRIYRQKWDHCLMPREEEYMGGLKIQGIQEVAVFGTGNAARSLSAMLDKNGIRIKAFTSTLCKAAGEYFLDRPIVPLKLLDEERYDRLIAASQFFFEVESAIRSYDPLQQPLYPALI